MIVSHELKCIFVAVPKTATHAIRFALRRHLAPDDVEQVGLFVKKKAPYPEIARKQHGHITALEIRNAVGTEIWQSYFSFAFVRNPWDRFISNYFFYYRNNPAMLTRWREMMPEVLGNPRERARLLMKPQHSFLCDHHDRILVDYVGRYESLTRDFQHVCQAIGIPEQSLGRVNGSRHNDYHDYFDAALADAVGKWYSNDLVLFDYAFEDGREPRHESNHDRYPRLSAPR